MQRHITNRKSAPEGENTSTAQPKEVEFIDEVELLKRLPVSRRTIFQWRVSGKLPFLRVPGSRRILFHWPTLRQALLRLERNGGTQ
jgi:hypothetical protein